MRADLIYVLSLFATRYLSFLTIDDSRAPFITIRADTPTDAIYFSP